MSDFHLPSLSPEAALAAQASGALLVDLRKPAARAGDGRTIAGAAIQDPYALDHGAAILCHEGPLVFFCVHGHEVSRFGTALAMLHGRPAPFVTGGYEALVAAGAPVVPLPAAGPIGGGSATE